MRKLLGLLLLSAGLLSTPILAADGAMVLERSSAYTESLETCDNLHQIRTCAEFHFTKIPPMLRGQAQDTSTFGSVGSTVYLNDQPYRLEWVGPGYYLDNGAIVHARKGMAGSQWVEIYPENGRVYEGASLQDTNLDGIPGVADLLDLGFGGAARIVDVRLNVRVVPVN